MQTQGRIASRLLLPAALLLALASSAITAHSQEIKPGHTRPGAASELPASGESDSETQNQLLKILRLSPTLTSVVVRDPSLLSDADYVSRNSPELAQFLQAHPEVSRNPSFYLFSDLPKVKGEHSDEALERKIWPDLTPAPTRMPAIDMLLNDVGPFFVFIIFSGICLWLIRILLENRRWGRIFRLQTDVHTKLIDRFGNNQELLAYMETEAGKRFLEAAPIPVDFDRQPQNFPGAVSKVLMPLQIGVVLSLLGIGLLFLRYSLADLAAPLLVFGIVLLMPGLGFIISAAITWFLAGRLGLMPPQHSDTQANGSAR